MVSDCLHDPNSVNISALRKSPSSKDHCEDPWEREKNEASEFISSVLDQMIRVSATLNWFPIVIGFATDLGI